MLGQGNELHSRGSSAEDSLKFNVVFSQSRDRYDASLYKEAARRVVFKNCMSQCELTHEDLPNFNKKFYFAMPGAKACLQSCYNERMTAHFGATAADDNDMLLDFDAMRKEYQEYEKWHPRSRQAHLFDKGFPEN